MNRSFTLIEILVVIVVIGVLSAFILVGMSSISSKANIAKGQTFLNSMDNSLLLGRKSQWKLDDGVGSFILADSWGNSTGTLGSTGGVDANDPTWISIGCVSNNCLSFDGDNDYVGCGSPSSLNITSAITVSAWINPIIMPQDPYAGIITHSNHFYFLFNGVELNSYLYIGADYVLTTTNANIQVNKWYNVVMSYISGDWNIYVDGIKKANRTSQTGNLTGGLNNVYFGTDRLIADRYFRGLMDDVRIYDQVIPTSEIQNNYYLGINKLLNNNGISLNEFNQRVVELKNNIANK